MQLKVDGNTLFFTYDAQGTPATVSYNGTLYYYITNLQGDVTSIVDANGTTQVLCTYSAYGLRTHTIGNVSSGIGLYNPFWYRGYVYDTETGLYYLQSRYYNPAVGRFINADGYATTGQGFIGNNMFAYCGNNPVVYSDTSGNARNYCVMLTDSGGSHNSLIYRQDAYPCTHLTYGACTANYNSCGVIATYNALLLKGYSGYENSFTKILKDFEELGYPLMNGHLGTYPTKIGAYMTRRGVECYRWMGFGNPDNFMKSGDVLIISIWHHDVSKGMHTFTCVRTKTGWDAYNRYYMNTAKHYDSFYEIMEDDILWYVLMLF